MIGQALILPPALSVPAALPPLSLWPDTSAPSRSQPQPQSLSSPSEPRVTANTSTRNRPSASHSPSSLYSHHHPATLPSPLEFSSSSPDHLHTADAPSKPAQVSPSSFSQSTSSFACTPNIGQDAFTKESGCGSSSPTCKNKPLPSHAGVVLQSAKIEGLTAKKCHQQQRQQLAQALQISASMVKNWLNNQNRKRATLTREDSNMTATTTTTQHSTTTSTIMCHPDFGSIHSPITSPNSSPGVIQQSTPSHPSVARKRSRIYSPPSAESQSPTDLPYSSEALGSSGINPKRRVHGHSFRRRHQPQCSQYRPTPESHSQEFTSRDHSLPIFLSQPDPSSDSDVLAAHTHQHSHGDGQAQDGSPTTSQGVASLASASASTSSSSPSCLNGLVTLLSTVDQLITNQHTDSRSFGPRKGYSRGLMKLTCTVVQHLTSVHVQTLPLPASGPDSFSTLAVGSVTSSLASELFIKMHFVLHLSLSQLVTEYNTLVHTLQQEMQQFQHHQHQQPKPGQGPDQPSVFGRARDVLCYMWEVSSCLEYLLSYDPANRDEPSGHRLQDLQSIMRQQQKTTTQQQQTHQIPPSHLDPLFAAAVTFVLSMQTVPSQSNHSHTAKSSSVSNPSPLSTNPPTP